MTQTHKILQRNIANKDLQQVLQATASRVDRKLQCCLENLNVQSNLLKAMQYSTLAHGKRIRPFLVLQCANLFSADEQQAMIVAASVELIHCYSLIHDDLPAMDDDDLRRGIPTLHKLYSDATAILAGDSLQSLAFELLAQEYCHHDALVRVELIKKLAQAIGVKGMAGGQMLDMEAEKNETTLNYDSLTSLQSMKTGALISFCCEAGAIIGNASKEHQQALCSFAYDLGLAYQMSDDLLDVTSSCQQTGKAIAKDAKRGKATFVSLLGMKGARAQLQLIVDQAISSLDCFDDRANYLREFAKFTLVRKK